MGDDPLTVRLHPKVVTDGAGRGRLFGGSARQIDGLRTDLIRFPGPRPRWAHVQQFSPIAVHAWVTIRPRSGYTRLAC